MEAMRALGLALQTCTWQWNWNPESKRWLPGQGGYQGSGECWAQGDFGVRAKLRTGLPLLKSTGMGLATPQRLGIVKREVR